MTDAERQRLVAGLIFASGVRTPDDTAAITLPGNELRNWRWCDEQEAAQRLLPVMAR